MNQNRLVKIKDLLIDLIFPKFCFGCSSDRQWLCPSCAQKIILVKTQICPDCGKISISGKYCRPCHEPNALAGIITAAYFKEGPIQELIHNFKYNHILELQEPLGKIMAVALQENIVLKKDFLITPVPLHWLRKKSRGYNQSEILAKVIAKKLNLNYQELLTKTKSTKRQVGLKGNERRKNLENVFEIYPKAEVFGKTIILVDDILTTGTTIQECAKVLRDAGAKKVWGLVVAKG